MRILISIIFLFGFERSAFAEDRKAIGTFVLVCGPKSRVKKVELYDLFEAREKRGITPKGMEGKTLTYEEKAKILIRRIEAWEPSRAKKYKMWLDEFINGRSVLFSKNVLSYNKSVGNTITPKGCRLVLAAKFSPGKIQGDKEFFFRKDLWDKMDSTNKASLLLSLFIYRELSFENDDLAHTNSLRARYFNSTLASLSENISQRDYVLALSYAHFSRYTYKGFTFFLNTSQGDSTKPEKVIRFLPDFHTKTNTIKSGRLEVIRVFLEGYQIDICGRHHPDCYDRIQIEFDEHFKISKLWTSSPHANLKVTHKNLEISALSGIRKIIVTEDSMLKLYAQHSRLLVENDIMNIEASPLKKLNRKSVEDSKLHLNYAYTFNKMGRLVGDYKFTFSSIRLGHATLSRNGESDHSDLDISLDNEGVTKKICVKSTFLGGKQCFHSGLKLRNTLEKISKVYGLISPYDHYNRDAEAYSLFTKGNARRVVIRRCRKTVKKISMLLPDYSKKLDSRLCEKSTSCSRVIFPKLFGHYFKQPAGVVA